MSQPSNESSNNENIANESVYEYRENWEIGSFNKFILMLRPQRLLWDGKDGEYEDVVARCNALEEIRRDMREPSLTLAELICMLKSLQSMYYTEVQKVMNTEGYVSPIPWFQFVDSFMRETVPGNEKDSSTSDCKKEVKEVENVADMEPVEYNKFQRKQKKKQVDSGRLLEYNNRKLSRQMQRKLKQHEARMRAQDTNMSSFTRELTKARAQNAVEEIINMSEDWKMVVRVEDVNKLSITFTSKQPQNKNKKSPASNFEMNLELGPDVMDQMVGNERKITNVMNSLRDESHEQRELGVTEEETKFELTDKEKYEVIEAQDTEFTKKQDSEATDEEKSVHAKANLNFLDAENQVQGADANNDVDTINTDFEKVSIDKTATADENIIEPCNSEVPQSTCSLM